MENVNFYFENTQGNHSKFWAVSIQESSKNDWIVLRRWGKIGDNGRTMQERFFSYRDAKKLRDSLIMDKERKGYCPIL